MAGSEVDTNPNTGWGERKGRSNKRDREKDREKHHTFHYSMHSKGEHFQFIPLSSDQLTETTMLFKIFCCVHFSIC